LYFLDSAGSVESPVLRLARPEHPRR